MPRDIVQRITAIDRTKRAFRSVTKSIGGIKSSFAGLSAALGAGAFVLATKKSLEFADSIDKVAKASGQSIGRLQEIRFAGRQTGASFDEVDRALLKFNKRLGLARSGGGAAATAFKRLGTDVRQSLGDAFNESIDALAAMEDGTDRAALATELFGDDAQKLAETFKKGTRGLDEFGDKARRMGLVLSDDVVKGAVKANDQLAIMKSVLDAQFVSVFVQLAPAITSVGQAFADAAPKIAIFLDRFKDIKDQSRGAVEETIRNAAESFDVLQEKLQRRLELDKDSLGFTKADDWLLPSEEVIRAQLAAVEKQFQDGIKRLNQLGREVEPAPIKLPPLPDTSDQTDKIKKLTAAYVGITGPAQVFLDQQERAAQIFEQTRTPLENYTKQMTELGDLFREGLIDADTFNRAAEDFGSKLPSLVEELNADMEEGTKIAADFGSAFSSSFEDAIINGESLRDVMKGLGQDITRLITRELISKPLASSLTGLFSAGGGFDIGALFRASGGPVMAGAPYIVGEQGPELVVPKSAGTVIPNGQLGGVVNVYVNTPAGASPDAYRQSARQGAIEGSRLLQRGQGIR